MRKLFARISRLLSWSEDPYADKIAIAAFIGGTFLYISIFKFPLPITQPSSLAVLFGRSHSHST
jgi:hypothetical protein